MDRMKRTAAVLWMIVCAMAAAASGQTLGMVADHLTQSVTVFEAGTNRIRGTVFLGGAFTSIGDCSITFDQTRGFVTDFLSHVWVIDLTASAPVLASGPNPIPISNPGEDTALSPDGKFLLVCDGAGGPLPISVIDVATQTQVSTFSLGTDCNSVDVCEDGSVLVTSPSARTVRRLTLGATGSLSDTGEVMSTNPSNDSPNNVYCAPGGRTGIVVQRYPQEIVSFTIPGLHQVDVRALTGRDLTGISGAFTTDGTRFYARSNGSAVDAFTYNPATGAIGGSSLFSLPVAYAPTFFGMDQLALTPDDRLLYVPNGGSVSIFQADTGLLTGTLAGFAQPTGVCFPTSLPPIDLAMDVKPESVNPRSQGTITVQILTTPDFDAAEIDPATLRFGPAMATVERFSFEDVDRDGDLDLVLKFRTQAAGIRCGDTSVSIQGETFENRQVVGEASIRTAGCAR